MPGLLRPPARLHGLSSCQCAHARLRACRRLRRALGLAHSAGREPPASALGGEASTRPLPGVFMCTQLKDRASRGRLRDQQSRRRAQAPSCARGACENSQVGIISEPKAHERKPLGQQEVHWQNLREVARHAMLPGRAAHSGGSSAVPRGPSAAVCLPSAQCGKPANSYVRAVEGSRCHEHPRMAHSMNSAAFWIFSVSGRLI